MVKIFRHLLRSCVWQTLSVRRRCWFSRMTFSPIIAILENKNYIMSEVFGLFEFWIWSLDFKSFNLYQAVAEERNQRMRMESVINGGILSYFTMCNILSCGIFHNILSCVIFHHILTCGIFHHICITIWNTSHSIAIIFTSDRRCCEQAERGGRETEEGRGLRQREQECS